MHANDYMRAFTFHGLYTLQTLKFVFDVLSPLLPFHPKQSEKYRPMYILKGRSVVCIYALAYYVTYHE